ncbi:hypothetical protein M3Y94_00733400 [Aphelenchoides besseyi]|nr:hypothetical protein M3Y94_00733400 [Aphelenchoides besseyi]KAI6231911.1 Glutaredoxin domain-containing protein [Aphelenchoides besseyi]
MFRGFLQTNSRLLTQRSAQHRLLSLTSKLCELSPALKSKIQKLVDEDEVVMFMKGTPEEPMCGFSRTAKVVLEHHGIKYKSYDVLEDDDLRSGIKEFSDWPTIPQIYVKGKFIGGSDILKQMHMDGIFHEEFEKFGIKSRYSEN